MKLAKPQVDIGLSTNDPGPMLAFRQGTVGLKLDHVLPVRRGQNQHDALGSVVKINYHADPLPDAAPSGYRELIIRCSRSMRSMPAAKHGPPVTLGTTVQISTVLDPDGNWIELSQLASIIGTLS